MLLRQQRENNRAAFTLMEIIAVVTIILILAGAGVFIVQGVIDNTRKNRAKMDVMSIERAVMVYNQQNGNYPPDLETLMQAGPSGEPALLDRSVTNDPWNQPYVYEPQNKHPETQKPLIYSNGDPNSSVQKRIQNWSDAVQ